MISLRLWCSGSTKAFQAFRASSSLVSRSNFHLSICIFSQDDPLYRACLLSCFMAHNIHRDNHAWLRFVMFDIMIACFLLIGIGLGMWRGFFSSLLLMIATYVPMMGFIPFILTKFLHFVKLTIANTSDGINSIYWCPWRLCGHYLCYRIFLVASSLAHAFC